ncbi:MAG: serine/threonine protein kinase [Thermodesulfobacteriota bacterium]
MEQDAQSLREELYGVISHYAELADMASKGDVDPIGQIGRIIKKRFPYLLLVIRDLLPLLERGVMTYYDLLFNLIRAAQQFPDLETLADSRKEIEKIEQDSKALIYAVKWLDSKSNVRPSAQDLEQIHNTLSRLNTKYRVKYAPDASPDTTIIPFFVRGEQSVSEQVDVARTAEQVRRAVVELHHLMLQEEPSRSFFFFRKNGTEEMARELGELARFLFRCGFPVDRIAGGYHKGKLTDFLNGFILDNLISSADFVRGLQGLSFHLAQISLMDFASFFEIQADYCSLEDPNQVLDRIKLMKKKGRRGADLMEKVLTLYQRYETTQQGRLAQRFLAYRYSSSFGDYYGDRRQHEPRLDQTIELYKPLVERSAMDKQVLEDLDQNAQVYSSKTREQMVGLIKLIADSLERPDSVRGVKVKVLGDISSGAMGQVCLGIFRKRIVALKTVKTQIAHGFAEPVELLKYEAAMHAAVQTPEQHPNIVEYYGLVDQQGETIMIGGYYPSDSLTQFVEQVWTEKYKPPFAIHSRLNLATLEIMVHQLLECLRHMRTKGVIHRDLKTDNVLYLVDRDGKPSRLKLIDFGVALSVGPGAVDDLFKGKVVGTFSYMAPEQAKGKSVFQSDLFSVGVIFIVLLTGKLPMVFHKARSRQELVQQLVRIEREPRPPAVRLNPLLKKNSALEYIAATVDRMLDLDPLSRPDIEEVQNNFRDVFEQLGQEKYNISIFYHKD